MSTAGTTSREFYPSEHTKVIFRYGSEECKALEARYPGVRFNDVTVEVVARHCLKYMEHGGVDQDRDYMEVLFSVSGSGEALLAHGFMHQNWIDKMPKAGTLMSRACSVEGFGRVYRVQQTRTGYRLRWARYEDGLDRLCGVFFPPMWAAFREKARPAS